MVEVPCCVEHSRWRLPERSSSPELRPGVRFCGRRATLERPPRQVPDREAIPLLVGPRLPHTPARQRKAGDPGIDTIAEGEELSEIVGVGHGFVLGVNPGRTTHFERLGHGFGSLKALQDHLSQLDKSQTASSRVPYTPPTSHPSLPVIISAYPGRTPAGLASDLLSPVLR